MKDFVEHHTHYLAVVEIRDLKAQVAELETLLTQLEATITAEQPPDEVFRFFQRLHGLPEVGAPKHPAEQRVAELEAALREVDRYFGSELPPAGFPLGNVRAALAGNGGGA